MHPILTAFADPHEAGQDDRHHARHEAQGVAPCRRRQRRRQLLKHFPMATDGDSTGSRIPHDWNLNSSDDDDTIVSLFVFLLRLMLSQSCSCSWWYCSSVCSSVCCSYCCCPSFSFVLILPDFPRFLILLWIENITNRRIRLCLSDLRRSSKTCSFESQTDCEDPRRFFTQDNAFVRLCYGFF